MLPTDYGAPLVELIRRLHAGTTLRERVERLRWKRTGSREIAKRFYEQQNGETTAADGDSDRDAGEGVETNLAADQSSGEGGGQGGDEGGER
jgi:hypothetical protein